MGKYDHLQIEFEQGFIKKKWESVAQFAIAKGINPNGYIKRCTKGWKKKAELLIDEIPKIAKERAKEEFIERAAKEWETIYKNLGETSSIISEKIKEFADTTDFTYTDAQGNERLDSKAVKALVDAGISAATLHKKTYIKEDIPLTAESRQKIGETLAIKEGEQTQEVEDPLKGKSISEIELEIEKLND